MMNSRMSFCVLNLMIVGTPAFATEVLGV